MRKSRMVESLESRRLMALMDLDTNFGLNGFAGAGLHVQKLLTEQSDGKILALVDRHNNEYGYNYDIARFTADGKLDTTFGKSGYADAGFTPSQLFQTSSGKYIGTLLDQKINSVYGDFPLPTLHARAVRLNADGSIDTTYGKSGYSTVQVATGYNVNLNVDSIATLGPDDSLYFATTKRPTSTIPEKYKYTTQVLKIATNGKLDTRWARYGVYILPANYDGATAIHFSRTIDSVLALEDGSLMLAGTERQFDPTVESYAPEHNLETFSYLNRLSPTGKLNASFANQGEYKIENVQMRAYDDAPVALLEMDRGGFLFSFKSYARQQYFELSPKGKTASKVSELSERDSYSDYWFDLKKITDDRLLRIGGNGVAEVRKLSDGRWETQPFHNRTTPAPGVNGALYSPILTKDNWLITMGSTRTTNTPSENLIYRVSAGTGKEKRDDFIPNAQQHSISFTTYPQTERTANVFFFDATEKHLGYRQLNEDGFWSRTQWVDESNNAGVYLSAVNNAVAYTDGDKGDLKFAWRTRNGKFIVETVDTRSATGLYPSMISYNGGYAIAYYKKYDGDLKLAIRDGKGNWTIETIDYINDTGRIPKLVQKSHNGKLAIAYLTDRDRTIRLAEENVSAKRWTFQDVATTTGGVGALDLEYESYDYEFGPFDDAQLSTYISYYDAGPADLVIARRNGIGNAFQNYRSNLKGTVGLYPDVQDRGATIFYDRTSNQVRAAHLVDKLESTSVEIDDYILVNNAGPYVGSVNQGGSRYELIVSWYDTAKRGLQIRPTGWYQ